MRFLAILILAASLVPSAWFAWQWRALEGLGGFHDDALYVVSARSLAEGGGYRIASLPGAPYQTKYPPLYAWLLSLIWRLDPSFPENLPKVVFLSWISLAAGTWLLMRLLIAGGTAKWPAAAIAGFFALTPAALTLSVSAMSELPCCALTFAALLLAEKRRPGLAGLCAGLAFLTRSSALPLLVTTPAAYLLFWGRERRREAVRFVAGMLPLVAAWQIWAALHRAPNDPLTLYYTDYLGFYRYDLLQTDWLGMLADNLNRAAVTIGGYVVFDTDDGFAMLTLWRLVAAAAISGCIRLGRSGRHWHFLLFGVVYLLQMLVWNYPPNERFLLPLAPLVWAGFWREMEELAEMVQGAFRKGGAERAVAAALSLLLVGLGVAAARGLRFGIAEAVPQLFAQRSELTTGRREAMQWIARHTAPDAVLLSFHDPVDYLYTGRRGHSLRVPPSLLKRSERGELDRFFAATPDLATRHGVSYAVTSASDYNDGPQEVAAKAYWSLFDDRSRFELVFERGRSRVYRFAGQAAARAD